MATARREMVLTSDTKVLLNARSKRLPPAAPVAPRIKIFMAFKLTFILSQRNRGSAGKRSLVRPVPPQTPAAWNALLCPAGLAGTLPGQEAGANPSSTSAVPLKESIRTVSVVAS